MMRLGTALRLARISNLPTVWSNVLAATAVDPRSKTPAFKSIPVWIEV